MLAVLIGCALRRGELLGLTLGSIQLREGHWGIAQRLKICGGDETVCHDPEFRFDKKVPRLFYPSWVRASFSIVTKAARASSGVRSGAGNARRTGRGPSAVTADISKP